MKDKIENKNDNNNNNNLKYKDSNYIKKKIIGLKF